MSKTASVEKEQAAARRVLVVDDDSSVRSMISQYLELEGFSTHEASNGQEAVLAAESHPPQAVVLDVMMPGLDGYQVCRALRENPRTSRSVILFLSVLNSSKSKVEGLEAGGDDFLTKPFEPTELLARLRAHLRRLSLQQEKEHMLEHLAERLAFMNRRLQEEAATDYLTGLYNRRYFLRLFEEEHARAMRGGRQLSFILLDVDRFKTVNDCYGHPVGDKVLKEVAGLFRAQLRGVDISCRYGGEEFAVLLPETSLQNAKIIAERLRAACQALTVPPVLAGEVTLSAGLASFPNHGVYPQELYMKADQALYAAKAAGRNCLAVAS